MGEGMGKRAALGGDKGKGPAKAGRKSKGEKAGR
jgi:hypothetical protein